MVVGQPAMLRIGGRSTLGVGKSQTMPVLKPLVEVGGNKLFAEVLTRLRKILTLSSLTKGLSENTRVSTKGTVCDWVIYDWG
jgi:GTP:adenosylcobinamide-phosphate guanylyltransferase